MNNNELKKVGKMIGKVVGGTLIGTAFVVVEFVGGNLLAAPTLISDGLVRGFKVVGLIEDDEE